MADTKTAGAPSATKKPTSTSSAIASHGKQSSATALKEHGGKGDKYSVESLRANMSTGGGEPIPAGHKWTNEKRRLQPRDPDTGHFTYNADAQYGLKYKSHGKADATPIGAKRFNFGDGIKKGDKIAINDKVYIAIRDMNYEEVKDYFRHFDEEYGDYYSYGEKPSEAAGDIEQETTLTHDLKGSSLSSAFIKKRGRVSKEEQAAMDAGETKLGTFDMSKLGKYSMKEMAAKTKEYLEGMTPSDKITMQEAHITLPKKKANEAYNAEKDARGWVAGRPFHSGHWSLTPKGISAFTGKPPVPTTGGGSSTTPTPSTPIGSSTTTPKTSSSDVGTSTASTTLGTEKSKKVKETFGDVSEAKSNPGKYLTEHKEMLTSFQQSLKENGVDISLEKIVSTIANMSEDELADLISDEE